MNTNISNGMEIKWEAPEFAEHKRGAFWYYGIVLISIALVALSAWRGNFLFAIFVIIAAALIIAWSFEKPPTHLFSVSEHEIRAGVSRTYRIPEIESFAIVNAGQEGDKWGKLVLRPKGRFHTDIHLNIPSENIEEVKSFLMRMLPQFAHQESLMEEIINALRL